MSKAYSIDLSALKTNSTGTAGYYTVAKGTMNKFTAAQSSVAAAVATTPMESVKSGDTVASVAISGDTYTLSYRAGSTAANITGASGKTDKEVWHITTYGGNDTIDATSFAEGTTVNAGAGNNVVKGGTGMTLTTSSGKDSIVAGAKDTISSGAGNDSIVINATATDVVVNAGDGDDIVSVFGANASVNAGAGKDSIIIGADSATVDAGNGDDLVSLGASKKATIALGAGKDTLSVGADASATLTDYVFGTDVITGVTYTGLEKQTSLKSGSVFGTDGKLAVGNQSVTVNKTSNYYAVELTDSSDPTKKQAFAWATADGGTLNASSYTKGAIITGANNEETGDYIIGGSGKDTIIAGTYDSVYGGKGNDSIVLTGDYDVVGLANDGSKDSVYGASFSTTDFDEKDTTLYFSGSLATAKFSLSGGKLTAVNGKSTVEFEVLGSTTNENLKVTNGSSTYNLEVVANKGTATLIDDATAVFGHDSGITVASDANDTVIDLGNTGKYGDTRYYSGINQAAAGDSGSQVTLVGGAKTKDTLYGGTGATSLYGGGSANDSLVGGDGADTFFYGGSDGRDTISGYTYNADDADKSDTIALLSTDLTKVTRTSDALKLTFGSGTNNSLTVTTADSTDTAIALSINGTQRLAKVGYTDSTANSLSYDSSVTYYQGGRGTDTLAVTGEDDATIWLDGRTGTTYKSIDVVNAQGSTGNVTLAGGKSSEILEAGTGDASLWGGASGNDTLVGGSGTNTFFFGKNNGSDTVQSTNEGDRVMLYDVALSDVNRSKTGANSNGAFIVTLNDGSKLTIENYSDNMQYTLADGATYTYQQAKGWTQA